MIELVGASDSNARIVVIGVGGGGGNAVNTMIRAGLSGVEIDKHFEDEAARKTMLDIFGLLGDHPLVDEYRPALARTLFR
jgi:cell division protein FtsZ